MAKPAFLFPGQASQYVGMGKDLFDKYSIAKQIFKKADEILELELSSICFAGNEAKLKQTEITQPAIFVHSHTVAKLLAEKHITPKAVAGHSMGEYSALVAADAISFEAGLLAVRKRGQLMQRAGTSNPGTMAAIVGLCAVEIKEICQEASVAGIVQPANFNSDSQIVISGTVAGVKKAMELAQQRGAKLVTELVVSGAFHSPLMESAQQELGKMLDSMEIQKANYPIYANVTAQPVQDPNEIRKLLFQQLTHPVKWFETIQNMIGNGITEFYEVGPGKVLAGLLKRIDRKVLVKTIGTVEDLENLD